MATPDSDVQRVYDDIRKFVTYLAGCNADENNFMLQREEIEGELWVEFVKGIKRYGDLPQEQLLAVLRRMMDNRVAELRYRFYVTHRAAENGMGDIEDMYETPASGVNPEDAAISSERIVQIRDELSDISKKIFDAIVYGNDMIEEHCRLAGWRRAYVYKGGGHVTLQPYLVANALALGISEVKKALAEIRATVRRIEHG